MISMVIIYSGEIVVFIVPPILSLVVSHNYFSPFSFIILKGGCLLLTLYHECTDRRKTPIFLTMIKSKLQIVSAPGVWLEITNHVLSNAQWNVLNENQNDIEYLKLV